MGGVGFLLKGSAEANTSVVFLKKSEEAPLNGSLSLKGSSASNGSERIETKRDEDPCGWKHLSLTVVIWSIYHMEAFLFCSGVLH